MNAGMTAGAIPHLYDGKVICRGALAFGNGCGTCAKCEDERKRKQMQSTAGMPDPGPAQTSGFINISLIYGSTFNYPSTAPTPYLANHQPPYQAATGKPLTFRNSKIIYYGPHECGTCGAMICKMGTEFGGNAFTYPEGPIYPNTEWHPHVCDPGRVAAQGAGTQSAGTQGVAP